MVVDFRPSSTCWELNRLGTELSLLLNLKCLLSLEITFHISHNALCLHTSEDHTSTIRVWNMHLTGVDGRTVTQDDQVHSSILNIDIWTREICGDCSSPPQSVRKGGRVHPPPPKSLVQCYQKQGTSFFAATPDKIYLKWNVAVVQVYKPCSLVRVFTKWTISHKQMFSCLHVCTPTL